MRIAFTCLFMFGFLAINAQTNKFTCGHRHTKIPLRGGSVPEDPGNLRSDTLDVIKYDLSLDFTMMNSQQISGHCRVDFQSLMDDITLIHLDLKDLTVDSVLMNNDQLVFSQSGESLFVNLQQSVNTGDAFSIFVFYHGSPTSDATWGGFYFSSGYAYNLGVGFTSVPHNYGRCWFPCFDNFVERSQFDFHMLTNQGRTAYCNGIRTGVETVGQDSLLTHWQLVETIPTYLACVAVTNYTHVEQSFTSVTGDDIPIWLVAKAIDTTDMKQSLINLPSCLNIFEENYGPYRWSRVGYCAVPFSSGAMEHATSIAYPVVTLDGTTTYETLSAHELSHHWWGDLVTCRNAYDMWLNEGFARYSEAVFLEGLYGAESYDEYMRDIHKNVLLYAHISDGSRYPVSGVPSEYTYGDHVYEKGADIAHTLRSYMGDEVFFTAVRDMMEEKQFTDYSSEEFAEFLQQFTSADINGFFENWVYEPGFPEFRVRSFQNVGGNNWQVNIDQFRHYSTDLYSGVPLMLTALSADGTRYDTQVTVGGESSSPVIAVPEGFVPVVFFLNEDNAISLAVLSENKIINDDGINNLNYAEMDIDVESMGGQDSIFIRVENHWAAADENLVQGDFYISPDRWWNVYHTGDSTTQITGAIRYAGNSANTNYFDPLFFDYVIANNYAEDSLVLLYRANGEDPWLLWNDFEVLTAPGDDNWIGRIRIYGMKSGQYAWAVPTGPTAVSEVLSGFASIFYSRDKISVRSERTNAILDIYDIHGRIVHSERVNGNTDVDAKHWPAGVYVVRYRQSNVNYDYSTKIMIENE